MIPPRNISSIAQARSPGDEIFGDVARFRRKDVLVQPVVEGEIVGDSAKEAHCGVGVAVDQAWQYERAVRIDRLCRIVLGFEFRARADGHNRIAANGHGAVVDHAALSVHGDYRAAGYQQIYFLFREC